MPQYGAEGEHLSPTQPFPTHVPTLLPQHLSADDAFGLISFWDRAHCREQLARVRNDGLYTPPSTLRERILSPPDNDALIDGLHHVRLIGRLHYGRRQNIRGHVSRYFDDRHIVFRWPILRGLIALMDDDPLHQ